MARCVAGVFSIGRTIKRIVVTEKSKTMACNEESDLVYRRSEQQRCIATRTGNSDSNKPKLKRLLCYLSDDHSRPIVTTRLGRRNEGLYSE